MKTKQIFFQFRRHFLLSAIAILSIASTSNAQTASVRGRVVDVNKGAVPAALVTLISTLDSLRVYKTTTDSSGAFILRQLPSEIYTLRISSLFYLTDIRKGLSVNGEINLNEIILKDDTKDLGDVTISSTRSLIVQKPDRTTLNVSGNISATGANVLDVLNRAPGVSSNETGISLRGKQGVSVMIDGKIQPLSGEELIAFLKGLPAANVDNIDLINAPSSKYDAAGKGGVIDIRTKRNNAEGFNGSVNANVIQGRYSRQNGGVNLIYSEKRLDFQASYNIQNNNDFNSSYGFRQFNPPSAIQDRFDQQYFYKIDANIHNAQIGMTYAPLKTLKLSVSSRLYANNNSRKINNSNVRVSDQGKLISSTATLGRSDYSRLNPSFTFGLRQSGKNATFTMDIDYASYKTETTQINTSTKNTLEGLFQDKVHGQLDGNLPIVSLKADYEGKFDRLLDEFSTGLKYSSADATNSTLFVNDLGQALPQLTSEFQYKEKIIASYINAKRKIGRLNIQIGLRYERTNVGTGKQDAENLNRRNYGQLFPNVSVDFLVNKVHNIGFSVYKRIDRPTFRQLNPFRYYLNDNTYAVGNLDILPQLTTSFELNHQIYNKITLTYTYSKIRNNMFTVLEEDPQEPGIVRMIDRNLESTNYYGLNIAAPLNLAKWLKTFNSVTLYKNFYAGALAGTTLANGRFSWMFSSSQNFQLTPSWIAESNLNYFGKNQDGLQIVSPVFTALFAVQKQLLDKKLSLKLTLSDAFYSNVNKFSTQSALYNDRIVQRVDSQLLTFGLSYRMGRGGPGAKNKKNATDEIKQRAN